ncbi:zymogen granule membrane protein 16-like isoform X2 [Engraulis encrasicolus]|uniref:zymogen granule membrane protein 16-like isoform X2 n=1 Tax=Engraulis encrasicolus TaxID=184585 RepID=UPI002FD5F370
MYNMLSLMVLCLLGATSLSDAGYSYSPAVGRGEGTAYATEGEGRITAVRVWETYNGYITGFQLRYNFAWTPVYGRKYATENEMELFEGETIVQVWGKYHTSNYIYQIGFGTNRGRSLIVGQPRGYSFNFYPTHSGSELLKLSGRYNGKGITSIAAHWGDVNATTSH